MKTIKLTTRTGTRGDRFLSSDDAAYDKYLDSLSEIIVALEGVYRVEDDDSLRKEILAAIDDFCSCPLEAKNLSYEERMERFNKRRKENGKEEK